MLKRICSTVTVIFILCITLLFAYFQKEENEWISEYGYLNAYQVEEWSEFTPVTCKNNNWFKIYEMPGNVYALLEPFEEQVVISYLIPGDDKALLLDTGMGIGDIKNCVTQLTDKPITVLNSHVHHDHFGGNTQFDQVMCYDNDYAVQTLTEGMSHDELAEYVSEKSIINPPEEFSFDDYRRIGKAPTATVVDGQIIDLGGRQLEVMYTPGHEASSIMLIDEKNSILFTGDTWYPGPLLLISENSSLSDYNESMKKAANVVRDKNIQHIYGSHNSVVAGTDLFLETVDFFDNIVNKRTGDSKSDPWADEIEDILDMKIYEYSLNKRICVIVSENENPK